MAELKSLQTMCRQMIILMIKSKSDHQLRLSILDRLPTAILKDVLVDIVKQYELQHKLMEICQARCRACSGNRTQETVNLYVAMQQRIVRMIQERIARRRGRQY